MKQWMQWFAMGAIVAVMSACGGGGGGSTPPPVTPPTNGVTLQEGVHLIDEAGANGVLGKNVENDAQAIVISDALASTLKVGEVFFIPAGVSDQFPLGVSGKVETWTQNSDGTYNLKLAEIGFTDLMGKSILPDTTTELNEENFVGVIAPPEVTAGATSGQKIAKGSIKKSFLNGGVTFVSGDKTKRDSFIDGSITQNHIALNLEVNLAELASDAVEGEAKIGVKGSLTELKIVENHDIDLINWDKPYVQMNMSVTGKLDAALNIWGDFTTTLGNYNKTWDKVKETGFSIFGVKGEITGLSSEDKVGKYPIIGLVFVNPTPIPFYNKSTNAINTAKTGGFIVWVYVNAKGELTLDGSVGMGVHTKFELAINKPKDGKFTTKKVFEPLPDKRLLEIPVVNGTAKLTTQTGLSLHVDTFAGGIRIANIGADIAGRYEQWVNGEASWGIDKVGEPWSLKGNFCYYGNAGAGLIVYGAAEFGVESDIGDIQLELPHTQYPSENDIESADNGWVGTWYKFQTTTCQCNTTAFGVETSDTGTVGDGGDGYINGAGGEVYSESATVGGQPASGDEWIPDDVVLPTSCF